MGELLPSACILPNRCCTKPYLNYQIEDLKGEVWEDIKGYDGIYMVSNLGRIKSYQREIDMGIKGFRILPEKIKKQQVTKSNFKNLKFPSKKLQVSLCVNNVKKSFSISTLVGTAFIGVLKKEQIFSKKDKCWDNCKSENLQISNYSDCFKLAYSKGNNLRKKKVLIKNQQPKFIFIRLDDGKEFTGGDLCKEYNSQVRSNINKSIIKGKPAYGSFWEKQPL